MKINGNKVQGANIEYAVIPRSTGNLVFKATAILDRSEFNRLCPKPVPPKITKPGGRVVDDTSDKDFIAECAVYGEKDWAFTFLWSLKDSPGLEWETVDYNDSSTWLNYLKELEEAGFTTNEINLIGIAVGTANGLNQAKIDEAKRDFLASLTQPNESLSPTVEPNSTPSGDAANASASVPQG